MVTAVTDEELEQIAGAMRDMVSEITKTMLDGLGISVEFDSNAYQRLGDACIDRVADLTDQLGWVHRCSHGIVDPNTGSIFGGCEHQFK